MFILIIAVAYSVRIVHLSIECENIHDCPGSCGRCADGKLCNLKTGRCAEGCEAGWISDRCDKYIGEKVN